MNVCYEITAVPVPRDNPLIPPAAALAARLEPGQTLQFRLHRDSGRVRCYLASDSGEMLGMAFRNLPQSGYTLTPASLPFAGQTGALLGRDFQQRTLLTPGKPAARIYLPVPLERDENRAAALMEALHSMPAGCGIHFSIRRIRGLSDSTITYLHRMQCDDATISRLLFAGELYQVVGCVYGPGQAMLLPEVKYAFPGLTAVSVPLMSVSDDILDRYKSPVLPDAMQQLAAVLLPEEVAALTDLRGSCGKFGLPLNKDTLFGMPNPLADAQGAHIHLGVRASGENVDMPLADLRKHVLMTAMPGQGKGNMIASFALQLHRLGIPFLIIEGQKRECHHLRKEIPGLQVWEPKGEKFCFNALGLPGDVTLGEYRSFLGTMITEAFDVEGPLEPIFKDALNRVFAMHGFTDDATAGSPGTRPFGLSEYMETFSRILDEPNYSAKTQADIKTGGLARLKALFNQDQAVFDSCYSIPYEQLLTGENLIQLNCLSGDARQMFASLLLLSISGLFRLRGRTAGEGAVKLVIILDEAHALLENTEDAQGKSHRFSQEYEAMLKTLRSQGIGFVTVTQTTDGIPKTVGDICETKIFLGSSPYTGVASYREVIHADDTALEHLYLLNPGEGIYCKPSMPSGVYFKSPLILDRLELEQDYPSGNAYLKANPRFTLETFAECARCPARGKCSHNTKTAARQQAALLLAEFTGRLCAEPAKEREQALNSLLARICMYTDDIPLRYCILTQCVRDLNRTHPDILDLAALIKQVKNLWK